MNRLSDEWNISENQMTEITDMLFTFIKKLNEEKDVSKISADRITTWWLKYIEKPEWMKAKINEGIDFIAQVCEFIKKYKDCVNDIEVKVYELKYKDDEQMDGLRQFLADIMKAKGIKDDISNLSRSEVSRRINKAFYLNNEFDTLGDIPKGL